VANLAASRRWAAILNLVFLGAAIAFVVLNTVAASFLVSPGTSPAGLRLASAVQLATAGSAVVVMRRGPRQVLARLLPIDPDSPVTVFALVVTILIVGGQAGFQASADVLHQVATGPSLERIDIVGQELPFIAAALLGVGLFTRRRLAESLSRLGLVLPAWWQLVAGLALAGAGFFLSYGGEQLQGFLDPGLAERLRTATDHYYAHLLDPGGIALIALAAGISEEILFRGALQPRLGIIWTSLVFTSLHTQYGLSVDTLTVFITSCGLGLLRRFTNTSSSIVAHVAFDALAGLPTGPLYLLWTAVAEAGLLVLLAGAWLVARARPQPAPSQP